ncbi:MAG: hypothetical protein CMK32_12690 [Porticoccaceae bacterium]|nr:hypothetical protein [Porticoccaceae bacterium]
MPRTSPPGQHHPHTPVKLPLNTLFIALLLVLAGCSTTPQTDKLLGSTPVREPAYRELVDVPFFPQALYQCGPAALATVLQHSGIAVTPEALVARVYVPERQGSFQVEMVAASRQYERLPYVLPPRLQALLDAIDAGQPVLILQNLGLDWYPRWHYAVVVGYDLKAEKLFLRSGTTRRYEMAMRLFERTWRRADHWAMVTMVPGQIPPNADKRRYFLAAAAFEQFASPAAVREVWQRGIEEWPGDADIGLGFGNFLYNQGAYRQAEHTYRQVIDDNSDFAPAYNNLAEALLAQDRAADALPHAARALELGTEDTNLYRETYRKVLEAAQ